ncbi:MAG: hypothetical protein WCQ23_02370 [Candidatus Methanomethylophilaceae archaeon]|jgi:hypothetical protein
MTVKSERGRRRYILFKLTSDISREDLIRMANRSCGKENAPYVVQSTKGMCIVRCSPAEIEHTVGVISEVDPGCTSVTTSGTLRTIRSRYPEMRVKARRS